MTRRAGITLNLRAAISTFTVLPAGQIRLDAKKDPSAGSGPARMLAWLPLLGAAVGAAGGLVFVAVVAISAGAGLLGGLLAVAVLALLTRGLHLDGLADTADGLGSRAVPEQALEVMRRSDIGPFGVITVVITLGVDAAAVALFSAHSWHAVAALALAAGTGRLAVVQAALPGIPAARPGGFGALVAGSVPRAHAAALTVAVLAGAVGLAAVCHLDLLAWPLIVAGSLLITAAFRAHVTRRIGGVTGDVFGALVELGTAATLLGLALSVR